VEIMFPDFALVAADQLFNQIGKARYMYGDTTEMPLVVRSRVAVGCGYGAQHSMDPAALYAMFPGWRIVAPANAFDYVGLFNSAMRSNDPVLIIEHHALYKNKFPVPVGDIDYCIPFGNARLVSRGSDITVVSYGCMSWRLPELIPQLEANGVSADIIDLRSIDFPSIDYNLIGESLRDTGVLAVVEEAPASMSIGSRITAEATKRFFDYLDAPPGCLNSKDVYNPVSRFLENEVMLSNAEIVDTLACMAKRKWF